MLSWRHCWFPQVVEGLTTYYRRGQFAGQATKYRKGACKNCGAMTHQEKDCVERPRKVGAWKTGADIRPDEVVHSELNLGYDGKRDRYNGYDPGEHKRVIERFEKAEAERRKVKAAERNAAYVKKSEDDKTASASGSDGKAATDDAAAARKARHAARRAERKARKEKKEDGAEVKEGDAEGTGSGSGSDSDSDSDSDAGSDSSDDDVREKETAEAAGQELRRFTTKVRRRGRDDLACCGVVGVVGIVGVVGGGGDGGDGGRRRRPFVIMIVHCGERPLQLACDACVRFVCARRRRCPSVTFAFARIQPSTCGIWT
jgi:hypothetical protein